MSEPIQLIVYGSPAPQGSKRHIGKGMMVEMSKKVGPWRSEIKYAALAQRPDKPLDGPLRVDVVFTMPKPKSAPKNRITYPTKQPDLDKLLRSTLDGLVQGGMIEDDARIIALHGFKVYPNEGANALDLPGARIFIEQLET